MSWIEKIRTGKLGWKTITSALVIALSAALQQMGVITPDQADLILKLATAFGLYGLRDAQAKANP